MHSLIRTARVTGLLYLGLALSGLFGFLLLRRRLFVADDAEATLANLVAHEPLARAGIALELLTVLTQALVAVWFFRLFRAADPVAAGGITAFGLVNAVTILGSAALLATAMEMAHAPGGDAANTVQLLYSVSGNMWGVGALFFGLWLVPMGICVLRSGLMPRQLGWILIAGGIGYVLSAFIGYLAPAAGIVADALVLPATAGEFWMIGYLFVRGVRRNAPNESHGLPCPPAAFRSQPARLARYSYGRIAGAAILAACIEVGATPAGSLLLFRRHALVGGAAAVVDSGGGG